MSFDFGDDDDDDFGEFEGFGSDSNSDDGGDDGGSGMAPRFSMASASRAKEARGFFGDFMTRMRTTRTTPGEAAALRRRLSRRRPNQREVLTTTTMMIGEIQTKAMMILVKETREKMMMTTTTPTRLLLQDPQRIVSKMTTTTTTTVTRDAPVGQSRTMMTPLEYEDDALEEEPDEGPVVSPFADADEEALPINFQIEKTTEFISDHIFKLSEMEDALNDCNGAGRVWEQHSDPVRLFVHPVEKVVVADLINTSDETFNKVITVLAVLCDDVSELKSKAESDMYQSLIVFGKYRMAARSLSEILATARSKS